MLMLLGLLEEEMSTLLCEVEGLPRHSIVADGCIVIFKCPKKF